MLKKYKQWRLQNQIDSLTVDIAHWQARLAVVETAASLFSYNLHMDEISAAKTKVETTKVKLAITERKLKELNTNEIHQKTR